jgi:hypothetical protein
METLGNKIKQNSAKKYCCFYCDYNTDRKGNFDAHLISTRHVTNSANGNIGIENGNNGNKIKQKLSNNNYYSCQICDKQFVNRSGLWKHKQKCFPINNEPVKKLSELDKDELIIQLLKQNAELIKGQQDMMINQQDMIIKLSENGINNNTNHSHNTTHTNSHNKAFNLNVFLNETCKNAMNITDFVDSIKLQLTDLIDIGELGYVEGISKIIVKNLNNLDETERPIHCTDKKRETMYIKDEGQWEKEDDNKSKLKKVVNKVADKNIRLLPQFREKFPDYKNASSKTSDKYEKMVIEVMNTEDDKKEKVIKKISNATIINK